MGRDALILKALEAIMYELEVTGFGTEKLRSVRKELKKELDNLE